MREKNPRSSCFFSSSMRTTSGISNGLNSIVDDPLHASAFWNFDGQHERSFYQCFSNLSSAARADEPLRTARATASGGSSCRGDLTAVIANQPSRKKSGSLLKNWSDFLEGSEFLSRGPDLW
jgi:hypothetical protein